MSGPRGSLTREDLPAEFTPESLRGIPVADLKRLSRPHNGILDADEQKAFDAALHDFMSQMRRRVEAQMDRSGWDRLAEGLKHAREQQGGEGGRRPIGREDKNLQRVARRLGQQIDVVEQLAPGVDWSFAQPEVDAVKANITVGPSTDPTAPTSSSTSSAADDTQTIGDIEEHLTDQVELVAVMSEIADVSKRTLALEQQRELSNTRSVFFGFLVSVAVLVAGWAPVVMATDWTQRWWILGLTLVTCVIAGLVYSLVRRRQSDEEGSA